MNKSDEKQQTSSVPLDKIVSLTEPPPFGVHPKGSFLRELEDLINCHSKEGGSNTPDFILAEYLKGCLENFDMCIRAREQWWGRETDLPVVAS